MSSNPDPAATSNQELLGGLQPGVARPAPAAGPRALLPWEREDHGTPTSPASSSSRPSAHPTPSVPAASVGGVSGSSGAVAPSAAMGSSATRGLSAKSGHDQGVFGSLSGMGSDPRPLAPVWTRVWCYVIDQTLALIVALAGAILVTLPITLQDPNSGQASDALVFVALPLMAFLVLSYFAAGYVLWGRTPGMMLGRLHVVDAGSGRRLSIGRAYLRSLVLNAQIVSGILTIVWLVVTSNSATRQGPHDSAARSVVLRAS